jgi:hypothetical protein
MLTSTGCCERPLHNDPDAGNGDAEPEKGDFSLLLLPDADGIEATASAESAISADLPADAIILIVMIDRFRRHDDPIFSHLCPNLQEMKNSQFARDRIRISCQ